MFQNQVGAGDVAIRLPIAACTQQNGAQCGSIEVTYDATRVEAVGYDSACTWDVAQVTSAGGSGSVTCDNAQNANKPDKLKISFNFKP
jgi:hypothetical protein